MTALFDLMFLKVRRQYVNWKEVDIPGVYAMCVVALFQIINIETIWFSIVTFTTVPETTKTVSLVCICVVISWNYLRYFVLVPIEKMEKAYGERVDDPKSIKIIIWYVVVSLILLVGIISARGTAQRAGEKAKVAIVCSEG